MERDILITESGDVRYVHDDELAQVFAGEPQWTTRASHVEPAREYGLDADGWVADMRPSGGPILLAPGSRPFATRALALLAERVWLREEWGL